MPSMMEAAVEAAKKLDWKLYTDVDPATLPYAERLPQLKALVGEYTVNPDVDPAQLITNGSFAPASANVRYAASYYAQLAARGARLPGFGRWVTSLWKDDKQVAADLAKLGKLVDAKSPMKISVDAADIMRCGFSTNFHSCFALTGHMHSQPKKIVSTCEGIAIAFIENPDGKLRGRAFIHCATDAKTGEDLFVVYANSGGTLTNKQVADAIHTKMPKVKVLQAIRYGADPLTGEEIDYVGSFKKAEYYDIVTYPARQVAYPIK